MKVLKPIFLGTVALIGLFSCTNENLSTTETRMGLVSLNIDKLSPSVTRAVETADYPVAIYSLSGDSVTSYARADQVPSRITFPVGQYYAEAHAPGVMEKIMDAPYYAGRDTFEILQNINTESVVVCRMANGCITVRYSEKFVEEFTDWTITVNDGGASAIFYTREDGLEPAPQYIQFEEDVQMLIVNIAGTTKGGNRITTASTLTKQQASERYDSDTKCFSGGDHIVLNFEPVEGTEGNLTSITITANIKFEESEEEFEMEVEDYIPEDEEDEPTEDENSPITLNLPKNMVVSGATDPALGNTYIAAEHGIKSILVKMTSTSDDMMSSLADLAGRYEGVDFATGAEVVENQEMVRLFADLQKPLNVPSMGDKEYTFPIGNFFGLLQFLSGEHTFSLTIVDMEDNIKNGFLKLTVE